MKGQVEIVSLLIYTLKIQLKHLNLSCRVSVIQSPRVHSHIDPSNIQESGWGANGFIILILKSINIIRLLWLQAELWYQLLADTTEKTSQKNKYSRGPPVLRDVKQ